MFPGPTSFRLTASTHLFFSYFLLHISHSTFFPCLHTHSLSLTIIHTQWSVGTILLGLYSFMNDTAPTNGSEESSEEEKKQYAKASVEFNLKDK